MSTCDNAHSVAKCDCGTAHLPILEVWLSLFSFAHLKDKQQDEYTEAKSRTLQLRLLRPPQRVQGIERDGPLTNHVPARCGTLLNCCMALSASSGLL